MGEFLSYSITSGLLLLAMYLAYRIFLAGENQHSFNRSVLMCIYAVAFSLSPFISKIAEWNVGSQPQPLAIMAIEVTEVTGESITVPSEPVWATISIWIFLCGMIAVFIKTAITWARLIRVINSGTKSHYNGYTLVITDDEKFAPFSWMHYIVISRSDYASNREAITAHELKHVASHHWVDLFIAQIVCIINWFNPAAWLMRDELMLIHEYQADMAVIESGHNAQEYQMLLIKKAVGARFPSLANSLNHSKLKKRITMMYQEKSGAGRKFKALALVPMLALAIGVADVPSIRAAVSTIGRSGVSIDKSSESSAQNKVKVQVFKVTKISNDGNETTVVIKGNGLGDNLTVSGGTFTTGGKTYHAKSLKCNMTDGVAIITATFPFSEKYRNPSMTLMVDGKEVPFDLENFSNNAQSVTVGDKQDASAPIKIALNGKEKGNPSDLPDGMEIYFDGKKITRSEMEQLSPEQIASVTVDRKKNKMMISSKEDSAPVVTVVEGQSYTLPEDMETYLDGKKITREERKQLSPECIASITVDRKDNKILITSKKASEQNVIIVNDNSSSIPDDMEIYLDGKKITKSEMKKLSPESIHAITVDKKNKAMMITSK